MNVLSDRLKSLTDSTLFLERIQAQNLSHLMRIWHPHLLRRITATTAAGWQLLCIWINFENTGWAERDYIAGLMRMDINDWTSYWFIQAQSYGELLFMLFSHYYFIIHISHKAVAQIWSWEFWWIFFFSLLVLCGHILQKVCRWWASHLPAKYFTHIYWIGYCSSHNLETIDIRPIVSMQISLKHLSNEKHICIPLLLRVFCDHSA